MKKKWNYFSLLILSLMLGACSPNEDAAELYHKESPLQADIIMPEAFSGNDPFKVSLTQDGKKIDDANFVHFEIWKADGTFRLPMEEAEPAGDGTYTFNQNLTEDGLYYVKVHAGNNGSIIMPTKPFAVGELSKSDVEALNGMAPVESSNHEGHH
ncbi:hypothetical protein HP456_13750 [Bacillus haikouensis]|uniref:FixH family protein n=1 Tax=Bacillus haikouensis TaxID=1510468 RepID=UPI001551EA83|nr:FixH family protein [Bacillus haikouensis]NQD66975.1 hypothetical protein [Bacillus haikouensis]